MLYGCVARARACMCVLGEGGVGVGDEAVGLAVVEILRLARGEGPHHERPPLRHLRHVARALRTISVTVATTLVEAEVKRVTHTERESVCVCVYVCVAISKR